MVRTHPSIQKLPDTPGVYFFLGAKREVLYVGKATSLKDRVRSYFASNLVVTRGVQIVRMVELSTRVDFRATDSVLEALILEAKLIKELKPPFNVREKDDKSFNYLVITVQEEFPRLLTVRGKDLVAKHSELYAKSPKSKGKDIEPLVFGPFPHAGQFVEALRIIRKIFPFYDTKRPVTELKEKNDHRLRFNESIGVFPKAGTDKKEYARTIRHIVTIFEGKMKRVVRTLEKDMYRFAKEEKFELATQAKRQLFALQHIEDVSLIRRERQSVGEGSFRVEGYDVAHLGGDDTVGVMVVVAGGEIQKNEYRTFGIQHAVRGSDTGALTELLERRLAHPEWQYPRLIVLDGGRAQLNTAKQVLSKAGVHIPVIAVTKDASHRPKSILGLSKLKEKHQRDILLANAEAHRFSLAVHKKKRTKRMF
jgi:excinuclease ABC subunit C